MRFANILTATACLSGLVLAFYTPWPASTFITGTAFLSLAAAVLADHVRDRAR